MAERFKILPADESSAMPTPAAGEWGYIENGSSRQLVLRWLDAEGKHVCAGATPEGLLSPFDKFVREKACWLPDRWEIDVFPASWDMRCLEAWFKYALEVASDTRPRPDPRPSYYPTPRMLVRHAYLIARHLGHTPPTPESIVRTDLDGSLAALEEVRSFLKKVLAPQVLAPQVLVPQMKGREQEPLTGFERDRAFQLLDPAEQKAYLAFEYAESKEGHCLEDAEAHKLLDEEGISSDQGKLGILIDYEIPKFATWSRQLRNARKALQEQKYRRRGRPQITRSIVLGNQIENRSPDK